MEESTFSLFKAQEAAENYVNTLYEGTSTAYSSVNVAVDTSYRCLPVSEAVAPAVKQQCACIFTVRYVKGKSVVRSTDYINDAVMSKE